MWLQCVSAYPLLFLHTTCFTYAKADFNFNMNMNMYTHTSTKTQYHVLRYIVYTYRYENLKHSSHFTELFSLISFYLFHLLWWIKEWQSENDKLISKADKKPILGFEKILSKWVGTLAKFLSEAMKSIREWVKPVKIYSLPPIHIVIVTATTTCYIHMYSHWQIHLKIPEYVLHHTSYVLPSVLHTAL